MASTRLSPKIYRWLKAELEDWKAEGLITAEQAEQIANRYAASAVPGARANLITMVFSTMAGALVIIGIILFISFYWQQLPATVQMGLLVGGTIGFNALGLLVRRFVPEGRILSDAIFLMAAIFFGASVFLVPQIAGRTMRVADGMLLWTTGTILLVLVLDHPLFYAGLSFLVIGSLATAMVEDAYHLERTLYAILTGAVLCPVMIWAYGGRSVLSCLAVGVAFSWWLVSFTFLQGFELPGILVGTYLALVGTAVWVLSEWSQLASPMTQILRLLGAVTTSLAYLVLSARHACYDDWQSQARYYPEKLFFPANYLQLIPILIFLAIILAEWFSSRPSEQSPSHTKRFDKFLVPTVALVIALLILALSLSHFSVDASFPVVGTILGNVGAIFVASALIVLGVAYNQSERHFVGLGAFLLWLWMRWLDVFGANLLTGAVLFILSGAVFWIVVVVWIRFKRSLLTPAPQYISATGIPRFLVAARNWSAQRRPLGLLLCIVIECGLLVFLYVFM